MPSAEQEKLLEEQGTTQLRLSATLAECRLLPLVEQPLIN